MPSDQEMSRSTGEPQFHADRYPLSRPSRPACCVYFRLVNHNIVKLGRWATNERSPYARRNRESCQAVVIQERSVINGRL